MHLAGPLDKRQLHCWKRHPIRNACPSRSLNALATSTDEELRVWRAVWGRACISHSGSAAAQNRTSHHDVEQPVHCPILSGDLDKRLGANEQLYHCERDTHKSASGAAPLASVQIGSAGGRHWAPRKSSQESQTGLISRAWRLERMTHSVNRVMATACEHRLSSRLHRACRRQNQNVEHQERAHDASRSILLASQRAE